ncbi:hypothetical protein ACW4TU_41375 [Streptomyces sp. QTS52]
MSGEWISVIGTCLGAVIGMAAGVVQGRGTYRLWRNQVRRDAYASFVVCVQKYIDQLDLVRTSFGNGDLEKGQEQLQFADDTQLRFSEAAVRLEGPPKLAVVCRDTHVETMKYYLAVMGVGTNLLAHRTEGTVATVERWIRETDEGAVLNLETLGTESLERQAPIPSAKLAALKVEMKDARLSCGRSLQSFVGKAQGYLDRPSPWAVVRSLCLRQQSVEFRP